jgi:signal peptide peptidase SppA
MPTTKIVLAKKSQIDAVLTALESKQLRGGKPAVKAGVDDMYDSALKAWENLTAMRVENGVAIIPINGAISFDDPFAAFYGETTVKSISDNIDKAIADPSVHSILLDVNSPGGYVTGVEALSDKLYAVRGQKGLYAHTEGMAASAAYWIASAADKVFLGSGTAEVGSIGVYLVHFDYSALLNNAGVKVTEITAGEYKGLGSPYEPLTAQDKKLLQADVDYIYTRFVQAVARNRGMSAEDVLKSANGLTFFGADAVAKGLADGISTHQEVIAMTKEQEDKAKAEAAEKARQEAETAEKAAAEKRNAEALAKAQAEAEAAKAALKVYQEKEAAAAKESVEAEAKSAYKTAFGREATAEEVAYYASLSADGRKAHKAVLEETAKGRAALAAKAGLFQETATEGKGTESNAGGELLVVAAEALGFTGKK